MTNKDNGTESSSEMESNREYLEKRIIELQSIRDQYIGAIEAYKDVLNKIQEQDQNESESEESGTSVDT